MKQLTGLVLCTFLFLFPSLAHPPWGIVVDQHRNIYFADIMHNGMGTVWKLTHKGELIPLLRDFHAHNVSLDTNGNLITAHGENNHTLIRMHPQGQMDTLMHEEDYTEFNGGNCTWTPLGEIVFGAKKHLWRINEKGKREQLSNYTFAWNQTVFADGQGNYYGPDIGDSLGTLIKINPSGKAEVLATNLITKLTRPYQPHNDILMGMTEGCDGHLYIAEMAGQRIIKLLGDQQTETFYQSESHWFPTAIDFFAGDAYILEFKSKGGHEGPQVIKVDEAGNKSILFNYDQHKKGMAPSPSLPDQGQDPMLWVLIALAVGALLWGSSKKSTAWLLRKLTEWK